MGRAAMAAQRGASLPPSAVPLHRMQHPGRSIPMLPKMEPVKLSGAVPCALVSLPPHCLCWQSAEWQWRQRKGWPRWRHDAELRSLPTLAAQAGLLLRTTEPWRCHGTLPPWRKAWGRLGRVEAGLLPPKLLMATVNPPTPQAAALQAARPLRLLRPQRVGSGGPRQVGGGPGHGQGRPTCGVSLQPGYAVHPSGKRATMAPWPSKGKGNNLPGRCHASATMVPMELAVAPPPQWLSPRPMWRACPLAARPEARVGRAAAETRAAAWAEAHTVARAAARAVVATREAAKLHRRALATRHR
mmetsp:Transcript_104055/g.269382  ORF Transcript_104055/g.269382 Transcript_104055/m.269382 type:complete len:300 (+) Transcript_104055:1397-2296(+)